MATKEQFELLVDSIENYYQYNPDTLMPLLMLALAAQGKLSISYKQHRNACLVCSLSTKEICHYEWVKLDDNLNSQVKEMLDNSVEQISVEMELDRSLRPIYQIFQRNDTKDIVQEHHHRMGRLVLHSNNVASDKAHRQYATYILAHSLIDFPVAELQERYLDLFNYILEKSRLQPRRPRILVAQALAILLQYDGEGVVYNPFAGCSIAGAMLRPEKKFYGDADSNDKLYAAGMLLNYGMGISNKHFEQRDSTEWLKGKKIDYVLSTYTGFINGNTAFDLCLGKCLDDKEFVGKYAGMVVPREIFDKMTDNFKEALRRDWIDTIALLPFGEVAVLVDANRQQNRGLIRLINGNNPFAQVPIEEILWNTNYSTIIETERALQDGYIKSFFVPNLPDNEGFTKVRLGDVVSRIPRKVYDLRRVDENKRVLAYINRQEIWYGERWDENIEKRRINFLFSPAYLLDEDCLLVNSAGFPEPRLYKADNGHAFFADGFAFNLNGIDDPVMIAKELAKHYVLRQLHPYGINEMVPEPLTEDDYLNLVLYLPIEGYAEKMAREDALRNALSSDTVIKHDKIHYTIKNFISNGAFGYTYRAEMLDLTNGQKEIVALKEYFPRQFLKGGCVHENGKVVCFQDCANAFNECMTFFRYEPNYIGVLNQVPDHHVAELKSFFFKEEMGTMFYSMKYYPGNSLDDMIKSDQVPSSEQMITEKIIIPICKALSVMHSNMILHLDIKPENVVIDENGETVLIDFGVAQQYDENGNNVEERGNTHSYDRFSAPENTGGGMRHFCPQSDIYSTAATLYYMLTGKLPPYYRDTDGQKADVEYILNITLKCSEQMKHAIIEGMREYVSDRPANAQAFLNLFPGCENIKL